VTTPDEKKTITLVTSAPLEAAYRNLLVQSWSEDHFDEVISLLRKTLLASGVLLRFPWEERKKARPGRRSLTPPPNAREYLKEFIERLDTDLPEIPDEESEIRNTVKLHPQ
jgi:hypothetical protein